MTRAFELERDRLQAVAPNKFVAIEHIGSTAAPGLVAKPIIDILAAIASLDGADALVGRLGEHGYTTSRKFNATLAERRWLMRWKDGHRTHHLHIVAKGGRPSIERLAFCDPLCSDPALAQRHAALETELAARHHHDRKAHADAKTALVRATIQGVHGR